jgi:hypothetical protein
MMSSIQILTSILASIAPVAASPNITQHDILSLADVQRLMRTDLDNELDKIARVVDSTASIQNALQLSDMGKLHSKQHFNVRRRSLDWNENRDYNSEPNAAAAAAAASSEIVVDTLWNNLVQHAWSIAKSMHRSSIGSLIQTADSDDEIISCPFLVCAMDEKGQEHGHRTDDYEQIITAFNKGYDESLLVKSAHNETCGILTLNPFDAQRGIDNFKGKQRLTAMPLVDIMKIQPGTVDEVSSLGWSVPYYADDTNNMVSSSKNATEKLGLSWERVIVVDFAPGIGGMREESQLLEVVNTIVSDIQDIAEVGWLHRLNERERQSYQVDESVASVPTLSDMFSLTATLNKIDHVNNTRVEFWNEAFEKGLESKHSCSEMFSTLFVKPRSGYYSFDMILNPVDGPPPSDYYSSASNPACVASLIAGMSIHREYLTFWFT